jgi:Zn-dependent protease
MTMSKLNNQPAKSQAAVSSGTSPGPSLDLYAVALALLAALLVRFNLIPPIKW